MHVDSPNIVCRGLSGDGEGSSDGASHQLQEFRNGVGTYNDEPSMTPEMAPDRPFEPFVAAAAKAVEVSAPPIQTVVSEPYALVVGAAAITTAPPKVDVSPPVIEIGEEAPYTPV